MSLDNMKCLKCGSVPACTIELEQFPDVLLLFVTQHIDKKVLLCDNCKEELEDIFLISYIK